MHTRIILQPIAAPSILGLDLRRAGTAPGQESPKEEIWDKAENTPEHRVLRRKGYIRWLK